MTPERWRQVDRILEEALELPPDECVRFLDRMCAGDHALRRDVEAVLQAHRNAGTFLNNPALALAAKQLAVDEGKGLVGRTLGHYRILSFIGAGGMGEVYRALDPRLGREVAVKVLPEHLAQNPEALARFEREAKVVATLSHPNILAIHDVGEEQGIRYAVMEFLEGETLRDLLNKSQLGWRDAVTIGAAIADGLAAAHAKEIVHRDLKPENIFRTSDGRIKVLDFGLARRRPVPLPVDGFPTAGTLTEPWMVLGTVGYMSPEQIRGEEADAPSDIFSFGCVLYEMVTGKRAYARQTTAETMAAIVQGELPDPGELRQRASPDLEQLIVRCLQKDPASRYPSSRDLYNDLNGLLGRSPMQRPATQVREIRSKWARWIVASAAIVLAFVFGYAWWRNTNRSPLNVEKQRLVFTAPGSYGAASFSPDCGMITYTQDVNGIPHVFVKNLSSGDPIQITFAEAANRPQWSPRNDQIVFSAGPVSAGGAAPIYRDQDIWSVPPLGGTPRKLIEGGLNANWSRDGSKLVFERGTEIWIADSDGTNQRKVDGIPPIADLRRDRMPSLSPDGSLIAYFQVTTSGVLGDFWVIPAAGGQPRRLTSDIAEGSSPAWSPDGKYVVFASERGGSLTLWKIPVTGGSPPQPMLSGAGDDSDAGICGDRLLYRHTRQAFVLTLSDPLTSQTRELRNSTSEIVAPAFSPNGDRIAFFSHEADGEIHLFTIQPDGSKLTRITSGKGEQNTMPQWSADGAYLHYYQARPVLSYRKIPATGGQSIEIENGWNWGIQNSAQVDPAGERLVYSLTKQNGDRTALVRYLNSGKEEKLDVGLGNVRWAADGKSVLGFDRVPGRRDGNILVCPAKPGTCEKLTSGYMPRWSNDASIIYFLRFNKFSDGGDLYRIHRKTGVETPVAELRPLAANGHQYDISPRGEIVYVRYNSGPQELWLADLKP